MRILGDWADYLELVQIFDLSNHQNTFFDGIYG